MNDTGSVLMAHCGAKTVTREELKQIPVPEGTRTHRPLSHLQIVESLEEALSFRYLKIHHEEFAVSRDGMKMFGVMDLEVSFTGGRFSIGLRNSNDKSMRLALTAGYRVFVCDNMAFSGDFTPMLHKHTRNLDLIDSISIAVDRIHRGFASLEQGIKDMQALGLTDNDARVLIYRAFMERELKGVPRSLINPVHRHYFNPSHEAFRPRTLWSLSNAFTSAFKDLAPIKQFEVTARLGAFLKSYQEELNMGPEEIAKDTAGDLVRFPAGYVAAKTQEMLDDEDMAELLDREPDYSDDEYPFEKEEQDSQPEEEIHRQAA